MFHRNAIFALAVILGSSFAAQADAAEILAPPEAAAEVRWRDIDRQPVAWYATDEARAIAASVRLYQTEAGGWPKNRDMTVPPSVEFLAETALDHRAPTIDNGATYTQIRFLAAVASHTGPDLELNHAAAVRGLEYLLAAQYKNGGWPQYFPLRPGYYTHITFNDDAMVGVLELLRDVAAGREPFAWADPALRSRAAAAVGKGIACILRCQIVVAGRKTAWCAQHDEITFEPVPARAYEHVSLSGNESVGIVRFLMGVANPSPEIVAAIEGAVAWLEEVKLTGIRLQEIPAAGMPHGCDRIVVADPNALPLWARFYEIGTNRPLFGGRDTVIRYSFAEVEPERRSGYNWYVDAPRQLLERDYPRWKRQLDGQAANPPVP
jgi:PelA/Pel-15E family pectate lyase